MVFATPAAKRRLFFTPMRSTKRPRVQARTATRSFSTINRRTTRGPTTKGTLTQQVKSLQRVVRNLAPELKYVDNTVGSTNITTAGSVVHLTAIAQGDTQGTRTGNTVFVKSISIIGRWTRSSDVSASANNAYRIIVFVDKEQVADTAPSISDVISGSPIQNFPNLDNLERFRVLYFGPVLEAARMSPNANAYVIGTPSISPSVNVYFKLDIKPNIKVSYNGAAATDIEKNGIYIGYVSNDATDTIDTTTTCRVGYTDV